MLRVGEKAVAYTVGAKINEAALDTVIEKAVSEYTGAFAVINREFARICGKYGYTYINRENDMGDSGLRRSKTEYQPVSFVKKYRAVLK